MSEGSVRRSALAKERSAERANRRKARRLASKAKRPHRCMWGEERHEDGARFMVCGVCGRRLRICILPEY